MGKGGLNQAVRLSRGHLAVCHLNDCPPLRSVRSVRAVNRQLQSVSERSAKVLRLSQTEGITKPLLYLLALSKKERGEEGRSAAPRCCAVSPKGGAGGRGARASLASPPPPSPWRGPAAKETSRRERSGPSRFRGRCRKRVGEAGRRARKGGTGGSGRGARASFHTLPTAPSGPGPGPCRAA